MTLTTVQKGKIMGDMELSEKIAMLEKQIKKEAIRNERKDKKKMKEEIQMVRAMQKEWNVKLN